MTGQALHPMSKRLLSMPKTHHGLLSGIVGSMMLIAGPTMSCGIEPAQDRQAARYAASQCDLADAVLLDAPDLKALIEVGVEPVLIDVVPVKRTGETNISGYWVVNEAHENIAGSVWLPNVGNGALDDEMQAYFQTNLAQATAGDRNRLLVFYGNSDVLMSWNAAKHALDLGYERVAWLFRGLEGWQQSGEPTTLAVPEPLFRKPRINQASLSRQ